MSTTNGNALTRESILGAADLPAETFEVPRWGGTIVVKAVPTGHPRYVQYWSGQAELHKGQKITDDEKQVRRFVGAAILAAHAYDGDDEDGNPIAGARLFKFADANELRERHYNSVIQVANLGLALASNTEEEDRGLTVNALLRVGNYAQANGWPDAEQDKIADLINLLVEEANTDTSDHPDDDEDPLPEATVEAAAPDDEPDDVDDDEGEGDPLDEPEEGTSA